MPESWIFVLLNKTYLIIVTILIEISAISETCPKGSKFDKDTKKCEPTGLKCVKPAVEIDGGCYESKFSLFQIAFY